MPIFVALFTTETKMATFRGEYTGKLDDKGRLIFPSEFRDKSAPAETRFVVKKDVFERCLVMYSVEEWERQAEAIKGRLNFFNREHAKFWREYTRDRAEVFPDGKNGRILIPRRLLEMIGIEKEVVFAGQDNKIEIWAKEVWSTNNMRDDDFAALAEKILG